MIAYPESVVIMRGDYEYYQWMYIPASNKHWLWFMSLVVIGGCIPYIVVKMVRKYGQSKTSSTR